MAKKFHPGGVNFWLLMLCGASVLAIVVALVVGPRSGQPDAPPVRMGSEYVAMGDSYTALPGVPKQLSGDGVPAGCLRSSRNYPHEVARSAAVGSLRDVSCGSSSSADVMRPQPVEGGVNEPQATALTADTRLVTAGFGGGDAGILPAFAACLGDSDSPSDCRRRYSRSGDDELAAKVDAVAPALDKMTADISRRAPEAKLLLVGYPQIAPSDGTTCVDAVPLSAEDLEYFDFLTRRLNRQIEAAAERAQAEYVDTYGPSPDAGFCAPKDVRWIEPLETEDGAYPVHPNVRGAAGVAKVVIELTEQR